MNLSLTIFQIFRMPKRQKESKLLPGEGRPTAGLNLGDFLAARVPQQPTPQHQNTNSLESDFPSLSLTSSSEVKSKSKPGVWGSAGSTPPSGNDNVPTNPSTASSASKLTLATCSDPSDKPLLPYTISKTKKGSLPIRLETRNKGKKVTVIFNVTGDARELLKELKHAAGCGGVIRCMYKKVLTPTKPSSFQPDHHLTYP